MPATPAEANRLTPYCRTGSKVISAAPSVTITHQHVGGAQQHAHLRVVLARHQIVVDVEAELAQIEIGGDVERGDRRPADQADDGDQQDAGEPGGGVGDRAAPPEMAMIMAKMIRPSCVTPRICVNTDSTYG